MDWWGKLVSLFMDNFDSIFLNVQTVLDLFNTSIVDLAGQDTGATSWFTDLVLDFLAFFNVDLVSATPLDLLFGSFFNLIIAFTFYRWLRR